MTRSAIVRWFISHRDNILKHIANIHHMPSVLPFNEEYVYKNTLGIKFFIVKKCVVALTHSLYHEIKSTFEMAEFFEPAITLKQTSMFEEIYFIDYNSHNDSLTYVYAKDVNSGRYDTHMGLAIDLTKIPKTTIAGNVWTSLHNDNNQILTLEELFVYKDVLQP